MNYLGWENRETWNTHRWLTMDDDTTHAALAAAQADGAPGLREFVSTELLGPAMEASPMAADFLRNILDQVDWEALVTEIETRVEQP